VKKCWKGKKKERGGEERSLQRKVERDLSSPLRFPFQLPPSLSPLLFNSRVDFISEGRHTLPRHVESILLVVETTRRSSEQRDGLSRFFVLLLLPVLSSSSSSSSRFSRLPSFETDRGGEHQRQGSHGYRTSLVSLTFFSLSL